MDDILIQTISNPSYLVNWLTTVVIGLVAAVALIIAGWIIGTILKQVVAKLLQMLQLDEWAAKHKLKDAVGGVPLSRLTGSFVKWFTVLLFLQTAVYVINLGPLVMFLGELIKWLPAFIAGAFILVMGLLLTKFVKDKVVATNMAHKKTISAVLEFLILYLALVLAMRNAGLDVTVLEQAFVNAFTAFAMMMAIVLGIGFGLAYWKDIKQLATEIKKDYKL
ncbi:MAG: hypothetical protein V1676_01095 [Candidatus Diapherotrites archaeon]